MRRLVYPALAVLVAVLATAAASSSVISQTDDDVAEQVRIVARKLADGSIEFGLQQHREGSWSERLLPTSRFFPAAATVGRWLSSSPVTVGVAATPYVTPSDVEMRIVARRLADGRTEFALQVRQHDTSWGERLHPTRRMFPADTDAGRWLESTPLAAHLPPRAAKNYQLPEGAADLVDIRVSGLEVCGLHADGAVNCWGSNHWTQCEAGHSYCSGFPLGIGIFEPAGVFIAIAAGSEFYGLRADGTVTCWEGNTGSPCESWAIPEGSFTAISGYQNGGCGLRADGAATCWGLSERDPPEGTFAAITGNLQGGCGIGSDGNATCWGANEHVPAGNFTAISGDDSHGCGIRVDGTVACWGYIRYGTRDDDQYWSYRDRRTRDPFMSDGWLLGTLVVPEGTFTAVSVGQVHACGIRTDGTVTCWGLNTAGQATAPAGTFIAIAASGSRTCGVRTDGTATCWGMGIVEPPAGSFTAISAGETGYSGQPDHTCGIRTDRTITCWGPGPPEPPSGTFTAVTASIRHACGLRSDGTATCWGRSHYGATNAPGGTFTTISTGETHACGLRANGTAVCWGGNRPALRDAPDGVFAALQAGPFHTCGLRANGTLDCWGLGYTIPLGHGRGYVTPASGTFSSLSTGFGWCALRGDGTVSCWDLDDTPTPDESFTAISHGAVHTCGIRLNGTVTCWPTHLFGNITGQADAPDGTFIALAAGHHHTCGIREDHSLACWGAVQGPHTVWHITKQ